jgi:nitrile hydratase accessory protein
MKDEARREIEGPAAPPRLNGELVFEAPWQGRVFGLTHALCDADLFSWDDFQATLIQEIGAWERAGTDDAPYRYWERWLAATERLLADRGLCASGLLEAKTRELAARPHGHDHNHD